MIRIDGSLYESGGGMFRQALGLSILTGKSFVMDNIRALRPRPGLSYQHLYALSAAHQLCGARVEGNVLGSTQVVFEPGSVRKTRLSVDIGTAGSCTLLFQSLLLPLVFGGRKYTVKVRGGTDVAWSIPADYFSKVLVPALAKFAHISVRVLRRGYYPRGGGVMELVVQGKFADVSVAPSFSLLDRGVLFMIRGLSHASADLGSSRVAERQSDRASLSLASLKVPVDIQSSYVQADCTGSGLTVWGVCGDNEGVDLVNPVVIGESVLGEKGLSAERLGEVAAKKFVELYEARVPCDPYLCDQLIPFLGLVGGKIRTSLLTGHSLGNVYVVERFLGKRFVVEDTTLIV